MQRMPHVLQDIIHRRTTNYGALSRTTNYGALSRTTDYGALSRTTDYGALSRTTNYGALSRKETNTICGTFRMKNSFGMHHVENTKKPRHILLHTAHTHDSCISNDYVLILTGHVNNTKQTRHIFPHTSHTHDR